MNTVEIEFECGCFKKSDFEKKVSFENQQDAYNYTKIATEIMNEDFCSKHEFVGMRSEDDNFVIRVSDNLNPSSCSTDGDSGCSTGSCGC
ncbi:MAG: hypothetical protein OEW60_00460 [Thiovulaceae bacterium]|nr:hypothetical protein [Sulfurimonadaceae bacterium]